MRIALFQPDQPGNVGAILRLGTCFGVPVDIIEPCGFAYSDRALRRASMDYGPRALVQRHGDWEAFLAALPGRLVLLTTAAEQLLSAGRFLPDDTLLLGSEAKARRPKCTAAPTCDCAFRRSRARAP